MGLLIGHVPALVQEQKTIIQVLIVLWCLLTTVPHSPGKEYECICQTELCDILPDTQENRETAP